CRYHGQAGRNTGGPARSAARFTRRRGRSRQYHQGVVPMTWFRRQITMAAAGAVVLLVNADTALAVRSPFGIATPDNSGPAFTGPFGGLFAWVALRQAEFYKALT